MFTGLITTANVKYFLTISGALNILESIVVGDVNCVPDIALDKWGGHVIFLERAVMQLHSFTGSLALEDFYHVSNPSSNIFTWFNGPYSVECRLVSFY